MRANTGWLSGDSHRMVTLAFRVRLEDAPGACPGDKMKITADTRVATCQAGCIGSELFGTS